MLRTTSSLRVKRSPNCVNFYEGKERLNRMFYKTYSVINGLQALSTNSMRVNEMAKECPTVDYIATLFV